MNIIDIIIGALLVYSLFRGFKNGFFVEIASIAALLLGIWGAVRFSGFTERFFSEQMDWNPEHLGLIAFILTFILVVVAVHLVARLAEKLFRAIALGLLTRLAGMVVGVFKMAFILSVVLLIIDKLDDYTPEIIPEDMKSSSLLYSPIHSFVPNILPFFEFEEAKERVEKEFDKA